MVSAFENGLQLLGAGWFENVVNDGIFLTPFAQN